VETKEALMPKTPAELREQVERENKQPAEPGHDRTAEGETVPRPTREAFLGNLKKVGRPKPEND
jgi:hypothetical protein